jgi:pimeloyl-ACP methyl ester carboxylesterase
MFDTSNAWMDAMVAQPRDQQQESVGKIPSSGERFAPGAPGVQLCYQTYGDPGDEPLLLVMGLGGPMTWWDPQLCRMLAERGFYVIRYDNRDTGRSTKVRGRVTRAMLVRAFTGRRVRAPYGLSDLAADAFALLDHLGLDSAHVAGVSMGGMIAQTMAIERPDRVRSLTSIMSTTGKRSVGWQHPRLLPVLVTRRGRGRTAYARGSAAIWALIGSPLYPNDPADVLAKAEATFDRGWSNSGVLRQMLAVTTQPNRTEQLRGLRMPALVVHGTADRMVHPSGGRATAAAIQGAELLLIDGMGHDLPPALFETYADAIRRVANRA